MQGRHAMAQKASVVGQQIWVKAGIFVLVLVVFALLLIVPQIQKKSALEKDILRVQEDIKVQEVYYDPYHLLKARYEAKVLDELSLPAEGALGSDDIPQATAEIASCIGNSTSVTQGALHVNEIVPDPVSLQESGQQVLVNLDFFGDFFAFRSFLLQLGSLPYVKHVQEITMHEGKDGVLFNMKLRLSVGGQ